MRRMRNVIECLYLLYGWFILCFDVFKLIAFVALGLVSTVLRRGNGWEECLRNVLLLCYSLTHSFMLYAKKSTAIRISLFGNKRYTTVKSKVSN